MVYGIYVMEDNMNPATTPGPQAAYRQDCRLNLAACPDTYGFFASMISRGGRGLPNTSVWSPLDVCHAYTVVAYTGKVGNATTQRRPPFARPIAPSPPPRTRTGAVV